MEVRGGGGLLYKPKKKRNEPCLACWAISEKRYVSTLGSSSCAVQFACHRLLPSNSRRPFPKGIIIRNLKLPLVVEKKCPTTATAMNSQCAYHQLVVATYWLVGLPGRFNERHAS